MKFSLKPLLVALLALSVTACSKTADSDTTTTVDPATAANEAKADSMLAPSADNTATEAGDRAEGAAERAGANLDAAAKRAGDRLDAAADKAAAKTDAALNQADNALDRAGEAARKTAADAKANAEAARQ